MQTVHYIYIPGLGSDATVDRQRRVVKRWANSYRSVLFVDARWHEKSESFQQKFDRVCQEVRAYQADHPGKYCIVGASAGASMAVNAFVQLGLDGLVSIAGKMQHPEKIGAGYRASSPYFYDCVVKSEQNIISFDEATKSRILTISPLIDEVVARSDMTINGVQDIRLPAPGHFLGIAYSITLGARKFFHWFEHQP